MSKLQIIYQNNKPHGIRDSGGYLFFFTGINRWPDQDERYIKELKEQRELADYLLEKLKERK